MAIQKPGKLSGTINSSILLGRNLVISLEEFYISSSIYLLPKNFYYIVTDDLSLLENILTDMSNFKNISISSLLNKKISKWENVFNGIYICSE